MSRKSSNLATLESLCMSEGGSGHDGTILDVDGCRGTGTGYGLDLRLATCSWAPGGRLTADVQHELNANRAAGS